MAKKPAGALRPIIDAVTCPTCGAKKATKQKKGQYCLNSAGNPFYSGIHKERVAKAEKAGVDVSLLPNHKAPKGKGRGTPIKRSVKKSATKKAVKPFTGHIPPVQKEIESTGIEWNNNFYRPTGQIKICGALSVTVCEIVDVVIDEDPKEIYASLLEYFHSVKNPEELEEVLKLESVTLVKYNVTK